MVAPNWWENEDTTPVEGGWSNYLRQNEDASFRYTSEPSFPDPPASDWWGTPSQGAPQEDAFPEDVFGEIARLPQPFIDRLSAGPPLDLSRDFPTYGEMEFMNAEEGDFPIMQAYQKEIPQVPKNKDFFARTWDTITDIAGRPLGKVVDALSWSSDTMERVIGLAYWNDVPDFATKWELGKLTYEMGGVPIAGLGSASEVQKRKVRQDILSGRDINQIIQENEGGWTDLILKLVLDPLNLIGGIPGLTKLPMVGGSKFAKAMERGLAIEAIKLGISPLETLAEKALERATKAIDAATFEKEIGKFRTGLGWFKQTPVAKALDAQNEMYAMFTGITGNGIDANELYRVGDALRAGTPEVLREAYGEAVESFVGRKVVDVFKEEGVNIRAFKSLTKPVAESEDAWKALPERAPKGEAVRSDFYKNPQQQLDAFYADLQEQAFPAADRYFGVPDWKARPFWGEMDKLHSAVKRVLNVAYLNRPGFIAMNVLNNWFTRGFTVGFGRTGYTGAELAERGIRPGVFEKVAKDTGQFSREWATSAKDPLWKKGLQASVAVAGHFDRRSREQSYLKASERAWNWVWQFDDTATGGVKGFLPRLPQELRARLPRDFVENLEGRILGLKNEEGVMSLAQGIAVGDPGVSVEKYLLRLAQEQGLNPQQTRLFMETEEALKLRINDILRQAQGPEDVVRELDKIKGDLLGEVHIYREREAIPEHPRRYRDIYQGKADMEADIRKRQQTLWDAMERAMRGLGADADDIEAVKAAYSLADDKIDTARAKAWTEWETGRRFAREGVPPVAPTGQRLPGNLAKSSPRYNIGTAAYLPRFQSDLDKALYVLAQPKRSKADAQFLEFAHRALPGKTEAEIRAMGQKVKDSLKAAAQQATPGQLDIAPIFGQVTLPRGTVGIRNVWPAYRNERLATKQERTALVGAVLERNPALAGRFRFISQLEEDAHTFVDNLWERTFKQSEKMTDKAQLDALFESAYKLVGQTYQKEVEDALRALGISAKPPAFAMAGDYPMMGEMMTGRYNRWAAVLERVKRDAIADMARTADPRQAGLLDPADLKVVQDYVGGLAPYLKTARTGTMEVARSHTNFVMHNYDNKMGIDEFVKHIYPYEFWPTRTAYNWMKRTWHRPGATASLAKVYDNYADMNRDLPERLKHSVKVPVEMIERFMNNLGIPVPGLPDWAGNDMYFDPIQVMFPIAQWSNDWADEEKQQTLPARVMDYASRVGPGIAPWVTLPLAFSGALGKREDWISYQMSGFPYFLPGTRAQRAIAGFMANGKDDGTLDEDTKYRVLLGEGLPENRMREFLGLEPGEKWDEYRIHRMLANMTATNQISPEAAMDAMKMGKGKVWNKARVLASQESGIRALTGWAFGMPVAVYPEGEQIQRGIGKIRELFSREIERTGDRTLWGKFYGAFPEYQPRQAAVASDDKRAGILDTNLFFMKLGQVSDQYDGQLDDLERQIRELENAGGLRTKDGRENRKALRDRQQALYDGREAEMAGLKTEYPKASATPSIYDPPGERALKLLRTEYYAIKKGAGEDYAALKARRDAWLEKLPKEEGDFVPMQREANGIITRYRDLIRRAQENKVPRSEITKLYERRDDALELVTKEATKGITKERFLNFININKQEPTAELIQYQEAARLMGLYQAIPKEDRTQRRSFWEQNPLLEVYYGNDEPSDAVYRELDRMWEQYMARPEGSQERRDWMSMNAARLNALNAQVGKITSYGQPSELSQMWQEYYAMPEGSKARRDWMEANAARLNALNAQQGKQTTYGQPLPRAPRTPLPVQRGQQGRQTGQDRYLEQARQVAAAGGR